MYSILGSFHCQSKSTCVQAAGIRTVCSENACGCVCLWWCVQVCLPGWSVLGAAGMLVGTTRLTLSNALIVLESSG